MRNNFKFKTAGVNSSQTIFLIFDRTRFLSLDVHESCDFKPKKRNLNLPKNAYFANFRLLRTISEIITNFLPISFCDLLAEITFLLEKQPVKFIPL